MLLHVLDAQKRVPPQLGSLRSKLRPCVAIVVPRALEIRDCSRSSLHMLRPLSSGVRRTQKHVGQRFLVANVSKMIQFCGGRPSARSLLSNGNWARAGARMVTGITEA